VAVRDDGAAPRAGPRPPRRARPGSRPAWHPRERGAAPSSPTTGGAVTKPHLSGGGWPQASHLKDPRGRSPSLAPLSFMWSLAYEGGSRWRQASPALVYGEHPYGDRGCQRGVTARRDSAA
jgi:hypothetical protein